MEQLCYCSGRPLVYVPILDKSERMNRLIKHILFSLFLLIALTACGQANGEAVDDEVPEIITAELSAPAEIPPGETAEFHVTVKQGEQSVDDAEEIEFEFWLTDDKDNSEKMEAVAQGNGVYTVEKSFSESGKYHVQSHVTASSMHVMPVKVFTVSGEEKASSEDHKEEDAAEENHHHH